MPFYKNLLICWCSYLLQQETIPFAEFRTIVSPYLEAVNFRSLHVIKDNKYCMGPLWEA